MKTWSRKELSSGSGAGFTLIELMIVVAIIGILAAIAIPKFADMIRKSQEGATKGGLSELRSALHVYYADNEGVFPGDHLECLTLNGKYISEIPKAFIPGYHEKSAAVENNDDWGQAGMLVTAHPLPSLPPRRGAWRPPTLSPLGWGGAFSDEPEQLRMLSIDNGIWKYWNWDIQVDPKHRGDLWIGCTHTNLKGEIWSSL